MKKALGVCYDRLVDSSEYTQQVKTLTRTYFISASFLHPFGLSAKDYLVGAVSIIGAITTE